MDKGRLDMAAQMLQKAVEESGSQSGGIMDISPKRVSDKEHGKFLNKLFKDIAEDGEARKYLEEQRYKLFEDTLQKNIKKAKAAPMETPYGKSFFSYTPEGKLAGIPAKMLNETKGVVKKVGSAVPFAGPAMAAGEVLAGENDLGKMAAGLAGSEILGTLASMVPGSGVTKGIMAGTGAVAGYPVGQEVYKKVVPESVQEKLKLSPEERTKIKEMLSKMKKKVF
jgi:hypothetical protein